MVKPFLSIERLTQNFPDGAGGTMTVFENATFGVEKVNSFAYWGIPAAENLQS